MYAIKDNELNTYYNISEYNFGCEEGCFTVYLSKEDAEISIGFSELKNVSIVGLIVTPKANLLGVVGRKPYTRQGKTDQQIADIVGCSRRTVHNHLRGKPNKKGKYGKAIDKLLFVTLPTKGV